MKERVALNPTFPSAVAPGAPLVRRDGRAPNELRPVRIERGFVASSAGSALYRAGGTMVLATANLAEKVPPFLEGKGTGWLTAEYAMLPGSVPSRKSRGPDGRSTEIQRLIGRSLRAIVNFEILGPRTIHVDADVLQAEGGTRTAAITAATIAVHDAVRQKLGAEMAAAILKDTVAAISVGIVDGQPLLDLDYAEDVRADVDCNVVRLGSGGLIEVQGTGERGSFSRSLLDQLLDLAELGIDQLTRLQLEQLSQLVP